MKKSITILVLFMSLTLFSQQLHYGSGGTVFNSENKKVNSNEVRLLFEKNKEALELYNAGRSKKTWGNVLFYSGLGLVATNLIVAATTDNITTSYNQNNTSINSERANATMALIGGVLVAVSIPIKIGYPKKIKSAIEKYNKGLVSNNISCQKLTLIANNQQLGFRLEF